MCRSAFSPNTYPYGTSSVCAGCPAGFVYLMSGGSSNRHAGTVEVRRRQRNGFQASVQYTYAKAIDDAGLGGNSIAQNWLDRQRRTRLFRISISGMSGRRAGPVHTGNVHTRGRVLGWLARKAVQGMDADGASDRRERLAVDAGDSLRR